MGVIGSLSIRRKLILLLLLCIVVVLVLQAYSMNVILRQFHQEQSVQAFRHLFRELTLDLSERQQAVAATVSRMARHEEGNWSAGFPRPQDLLTLARDLRRQARAGGIDEVALYDPQGRLRVLRRERDDLLVAVVGREIKVSRGGGPWIAEALPPNVAFEMASRAADAGARIYQSGAALAVEATQPITSAAAEGAAPIGYLRGVQLLGSDFVAALTEREDVRFALVFDDGTTTGELRGVSPALLASMPVAEFGGGAELALLQRQHDLLTAVRIPLTGGAGVYAVSTMEKSLVEAELMRHRQLLVLVLLGSALVMVPTGLYATRRVISEPVRRLLRAAEAWAHGDFSRKVPVTSGDELGRLAHAFNAMAEALDRRERALVASEERYRSLIENLPLSVFFKDRDSVYRSCNARYAVDRGRTPEEIIGKTDFDLYPQELAERYRAGDRTMLETGAAIEFEEPNVQRGELHFVHTTKVPVRDNDGRIMGVLGIYFDVTERRRTEERLRQAAVVFESTAEGVMITDANNVIIAVNKAFTEITGFTAEEAIGATPRILRSERHDARFYRNMWESIATTGIWQGEIWNCRKNGEPYPEWMTISVVRDGNGKIMNYVAVFSDITVIKRSEAQLDYLAHHDPLTDLPNRLLFSSRLEHALERARRSNSSVAVLFLDLDRFKFVNDTLGHPTGDRLLKSVAKRLHDRLRASDTVARVGGDEFIVTVEEPDEHSDAKVVAQKLLDCFAAPFVIEGNELFLGASIGISLFPQDGTDVSTLVKNADAAMYRAKDLGRNTFCFYTTALGAEAEERFHMETALRHAIERNELELFYQPQVELATGRITGAEALLRWRDPRRGLITPDRFIALAEDTGLILAMGEWVMQTACAQFMRWHAQGLLLGNVSVNVSGVQVERGDVVGAVAKALAQTGMPAAALELEVTESVIMRQPLLAAGVLDGLRELGVEVAIDDFGTGYSSLSYLKRFPLDNLKIDKSFVRDIPQDLNDAAIIRAVIALADSLQLRVTAEGVETEEQRAFLLSHGCHYGQGYLFSRPLAAGDFENFVAAHQMRRSVPL